MPVNLQIKLLRVLQEHTLERLGSNQSIPVDCRVIAATKADLAAMGKSGQFRSDLYYRLNVVSLELPALRDRREDILLLFEHFLQQSSLRFDRPAPELDRATVASLMAHDWPGNVRELRNVAERFALGLPEEIKTLLSHGDLEMGHARALLGLPAERQVEGARHVVAHGLTVRQTEALVRQWTHAPGKPAGPVKSDPDIARLEQRLAERLGASVQIRHGQKGKGQLVIRYSSLDELQGVLAHIR